MKINEPQGTNRFLASPNLQNVEKHETKSFSDIFESLISIEEKPTLQKKNEDKNNDTKSKSEDENRPKLVTENEKDNRRENEKNDSDCAKDQRNTNQFVPNFQNPDLPFESAAAPTSLRLILPSIDLERLVFSAQTLKTRNGAEITINLVKSVFEGLQVKISMVAGEGLVVNFLARSDQARNHLEQHKEGLTKLLKERGLKVKKVHAMVKTDLDDPV